MNKMINLRKFLLIIPLDKWLDQTNLNLLKNLEKI